MKRTYKLLSKVYFYNNTVNMTLHMSAYFVKPDIPIELIELFTSKEFMRSCKNAEYKHVQTSEIKISCFIEVVCHL